MIVVADAAPLIFLAKINQLSLITELFNAEILIPSVVSKEILGPVVPPSEERVLTAFLSGCRIINIRKPFRFARALSFADNCILTLASKKQADVVLSDDRLLRKTAVIGDLRVIGTLGMLIRATKTSRLAPQKAVDLMNELVEEHNFRISIEVYEAARKAICAVKQNS